MTQLQSLAHSKWVCKYHLVWIPKYRKKTLFGNLRRELGPVLRELAQHRESEILEGHLMSDHVHILISIPPKYAASQVVGYIKGKSAIHIARTYMAVGLDAPSGAPLTALSGSPFKPPAKPVVYDQHEWRQHEGGEPRIKGGQRIWFVQDCLHPYVSHLLLHQHSGVRFSFELP